MKSLGATKCLHQSYNQQKQNVMDKLCQNSAVKINLILFMKIPGGTKCLQSME